MCGIFAITSSHPKANAAKTVLAGLKKLEYRGYDSWGIVVEDGSKLKVSKQVGKIGQAKPKLPRSKTGLGHTRWATHGGVTTANAHPFLDCTNTIALVHNGIIDNYLELKKSLKNKHKFDSETDSEVLLHLIEELAKKHNITDAVRFAFKKAEGLNAILVIHQGKIIAAKTGSPLVVGLGEGENYIASDLWSILDHTKKVVFLEDGQMVEITPKKVSFININSGKTLSPRVKNIKWHQSRSSKQNYPHFMIKEIMEQPKVIDQLSHQKQDQAKHLADQIKKADKTFFVACGTAAYAALVGQYLFSKHAAVQAIPAIGSEFIYYSNLLTPKSLVIALSQSGETIDTIQSVQNAQKQKATVVSLVNVLGSTLYRMSDSVILLDAGPEKAVASTKAFIAKITLLHMTAGFMNGQIKSAQAELTKAKLATQTLLSSPYRKKIQNIAKNISKTSSMFVVGRGTSYPAALETALKIKEISYIHAEGLAGGELKHGPIALIEKGTPCIVIAPDDETYHDAISGAMEMKARGAMIIGISNKKHEVFDRFLPVQDAGSATIIPNVIVGQLLAYELAVIKGLDPDKPRNLAKSVTVK